MDTSKVLADLEFPCNLFPANKEEIITALLGARNLGDTILFKTAEDKGCSIDSSTQWLIQLNVSAKTIK